jgi:hypothetical protein
VPNSGFSRSQKRYPFAQSPELRQAEDGQSPHRGRQPDPRLQLPPPNPRKGFVTPFRACGSADGSVAKGMKKISYRGYRFPSEIIQQAIWLYLRFTLSLRDVEDLLPERGIMVSYETVRRWVNHFGPLIAADLRKRRPKPHTTWHLDEVYLKIAGRMVYVWRAVDAEGEVLDVLVQSRLAWPFYCPFFSRTCLRFVTFGASGL